MDRKQKEALVLALAEKRQTIDELEAKKAELQKPNLNEPLLEFHEINGNKDVSLEVQQEDDAISINDVLIPQSNASINYNQNENETCHYHYQIEPSSRTLIFDTKDFSSSFRRPFFFKFNKGRLHFIEHSFRMKMINPYS
jgi:hypothetical protein